MAEQRIEVWVQNRKDRRHLQLEWHDQDTGRRRSAVTSPATNDLKEAERQRVLLEEALNTGRYGRDSRIGWPEFREAYEREYLSHLRFNTREKWAIVANVFEQETRVERLRQVNARWLSDFAWRLRSRVTPAGKRGLEPVTIHNYLVALKTALVWARSQGLMREVPPFPKIKVPKKKPQPISPEDYRKLVAAAPSADWRAFFLCGWWAGLRLSEVRLMAWTPSDVQPWLDLDGNRVVLPAKFVKADEDQSMPLHPELRAALEELPRDDPRVFPFRSVNGEYKGRHAVCNHVARIARKAGVRLSMHRLRKGFGCRVAKQLGKGNAPVLHTLMRHKSMQITMDYYVNITDALQDVIKELT